MVHVLLKKNPKGLIYWTSSVYYKKCINVTVTCTCMNTGVLSKWVWTKLLGKSLNDYWVSSMLLYEKHLILSVFFPIITSQIMPLTSKIVHPVFNEHSATVCALLIALKHFHCLAHMSYNYSINYKLLFFVKTNLINIEASEQV